MKIVFIITVLVIAILLLLENIFPKRKYSTKIKALSYLTDTLLSVFNNILLYIISIASLYYVAENISSIKLLSFLNFNNIGIILFTLVFLDFAIYVWHYMNHKFDFLWLFHKVHHSEKYLNTLSGIRFHIGELVGSILFKSFFLIFLLSIPIKIILISETIVLISSLFHHTNIKFRQEKFLGKLFVMPYLHQVHHSIIKKEHDSNFGVLFSFWDRLFNTLQEKEIKEIGLRDISFQNIFKTIIFGFKKQ